MSSPTALSSRSVAITGAGGGLGRGIALGLASKGYAVFGTAISEAEIQELKNASNGRARLMICDMTKPLERNPTPNWMRSASRLSVSTDATSPPPFFEEEIPMLILVDHNDSRAVRNKDNVLALYDLMINQKKSEEATAKFLRPDYIQHNPLIADGSVALGQYFAQVTREHERARVVVHKIIAVGDYVFAHVNFLNLVTDNPTDTGIAGVDIYRFDNEGKAVEHWDTLQLVGHPANSAPWIAPNIPRANPQGMF